MKIKQAEYNLELEDTTQAYDEFIGRLQTVLDLFGQIAAEAAEVTAAQVERGSGYGHPMTPEWPGLEEGGTLARGGVVKVGERGSELAILPTGTTVLPHAAVPANISNVSSDTWNINEANQPIDVVNAVRKYQAYRRITGGR